MRLNVYKNQEKINAFFSPFDKKRIVKTEKMIGLFLGGFLFYGIFSIANLLVCSGPTAFSSLRKKIWKRLPGEDDKQVSEIQGVYQRVESIVASATDSSSVKSSNKSDKPKTSSRQESSVVLDTPVSNKDNLAVIPEEIIEEMTKSTDELSKLEILPEVRKVDSEISDINILSKEKKKKYKKLKIITKNNIPFVFEKLEGGNFLVDRTSIFNTIDGDIENEKECLIFLLDIIYNLRTSKEEREIALEIACYIKKNTVSSGGINLLRNFSSKLVLSKELKILKDAQKIIKLSEKFKINPVLLFSDLELYRFIIKNGLHFKISKGTIACGFGPKVENGKLLFPWTKDDRTAEFFPYKEFPTDSRGFVKGLWTGHGFLNRKNNNNDLYSCRLEEINSEDDQIPEGKYAIDYVTKSPEWSIGKLLQLPLGPITHFTRAGFGHSWIQIRQTIYPKEGKKPYNRVISVGNRAGAGKAFGGKIISPDLREFKSDPIVSTRVILSQEKGEIALRKIQNRIEADQQRTSKGDLQQELTNMDRGTCVNFASAVFRDVTEERIVFNPKYRLQNWLCSIGQWPLFGSLVNQLTPNFLQNIFGKITHGELPWLAITEQLQLAEKAKQTGNLQVLNTGN